MGKKEIDDATIALRKEKERARMAAYRAANPEKVRAAKAKYYAANPEKFKAKVKEYTPRGQLFGFFKITGSS